ncbi:MAG: DUF4325 domain-containing protein [Clostridiales bacterium]|nr:DUF4325 domain-containing protein [Clostridiales bacterium]
MPLSKELREKVQLDLLKQIDIGKLSIEKTAREHKVSRQTVYRYIQNLLSQRILKELDSEKNKRKQYQLAEYKQNYSYNIKSNLAEDIIWRQDIAPFCHLLPPQAIKKAHFVFTEIMNNAIEHSEGKKIDVILSKTQLNLFMSIADDGVGIFQKIQTSLNLPEKSFSILELAKGKLTTDPDTHTGEGIFFSSRIADSFAIFSDELSFLSGLGENQSIPDTLFINKTRNLPGTDVCVKIYFDNTTGINDVFRKYTEHPEHISFSATQVPVALLEYGTKNPILVSRSEAKRLLSRCERFSRITLDFAGVEDMRQGFADEVFRVFPNFHPDCKLEVINCNAQIEAMITYVKNRK